ncbi:hypothetical protein ASTA108788_15825 [Asticcacaulis taihuensis]|uniref:Uncharacterized protein n=1 Tax=Asticcacaulis taihuensis TaxID=260084 RepID=A0A1G4RNN9_9CAUL|nr:hypothetical protein SAMN02927928_2080 [Asticcacaulis taihuensis]
MSKKRHRQRRNRQLIQEWIFKGLVLFGQGIYYVVRFWFIDWK